jgi:hypothetical protein
LEVTVLGQIRSKKKNFGRPHLNGKKNLDTAHACHSSYSRKQKIERGPISKIIRAKRAGDMAQV